MKKAVSVLSSAVAVLMLSATAYASTQSIMVSGNTSAGENQPGWMFNRDVSTSNPYEFNTAAASTGMGSLYVLPIGSTAANKFIGENFLNKPVADITTISYDFKIGTGGDGSDKDQFYMNVYANFGVSDDFKFYDCRYNVVPTVGSTGGFTTVTFDPTQAYPVTTRGGASSSPFTCPVVPADMNLLSPGSTVRAFALNVGDTSTSDVGLDGYLDNVVVTMGSDVTMYDFEPTLTPANKDACKKDGWMMFNTPFFKNQGDCVSFTQSNSHATANKNK